MIIFWPHGIFNSTLAAIEKISPRTKQITVKTENNKTIKFNPKDMNQFRHGYAVTAHKSQGSTIDKAIVLVDGHHMDSEKVYVSMSRGREGNVLICDKVTIGEPSYEQRKTFGLKTTKEYELAEEKFYKGQLCKMIGSSGKKDTTLEFFSDPLKKEPRGIISKLESTNLFENLWSSLAKALPLNSFFNGKENSFSFQKAKKKESSLDGGLANGE